MDTLTDILDTIYKAKSILLYCHLGPDADCVGANLATKAWLESLGKRATLICADTLPNNLDYLPEVHTIVKKQIEDVDQSKIDLFLSLDIAAWDMVSKKVAREFWRKPIVAIDHHPSSTPFTQDWLYEECSSLSEVMFRIFLKENFTMTKTIATQLLAGMYADTLGFKVDKVTPETFRILAKLVELGAKTSEASFNLERRVTPEKIAYWAVYLGNMRMNKKYRYCYTTVSRQEFDSDAKIDGEPKTTSLFLPVMEGTDFGFSLRESETGAIYGSFRARTDVDCSIFAKALGGGGHKKAPGFSFKPGISMEKALSEVQTVIEKYYSEMEKSKHE